ASGQYMLGKQCADTPVQWQNCSQQFRAALKRDPNFPEAAHDLALWLGRNGGARREQLQGVHHPEALAERAGPRLQTRMRAWAAHLDGKDVTALQLLGQVSKTWPEDRDAPYEMADILRRRDELAASVRWFEQALRIDPDFSRAGGELALVL